MRLAERARRPEMRQNLTTLAETWTKLAAQLESDEALLSVLSKLEVGEPIHALTLALKLHSWPLQSSSKIAQPSLE